MGKSRLSLLPKCGSPNWFWLPLLRRNFSGQKPYQQHNGERASLAIQVHIDNVEPVAPLQIQGVATVSAQRQSTGIFGFIRKKEYMRIFQSLDSRLIALLDVTTRDEAIDSLIDLLARAGKLPDKALFRQAIFHRE